MSPLFSVRLRDLPRTLHLHEVPCRTVAIGVLTVTTTFVCHPGPTVGYRIAAAGVVLTSISDHEPALGVPQFPGRRKWTAGASGSLRRTDVKKSISLTSASI